MALERLDHLRRLVLAQQTVVHEHAREAIADRLVHEQGGDCGIDAARERTEHTLAADLGADPLDLLLDHGSRRPGRSSARDLVEEVLQDVLAVRRVHDLGVELHAVERPLRVLEGGDRRRGGARRHLCPVRRSGHRVAVTHPDGLLLRQPRKESAPLRMKLGLAELGDAGPLDAPAEILRHQLHAVADPEHRDPEFEELRVDLRRPLGVDRRRPAREHDRGRPASPHLRGADSVADELRVDARLAHATSDQLGVLPAEVDDQYGTLLGRGLALGEGDYLTHRVCSWARPW